ncbi:IS1096 element passenger TnpR family protein [Novipirellula caenicola]|uniref:Plasmid pRiA4b Orf3-like domain-containing protein n=1 Tax=Novipirellula caenicola TaxID=1536901 RepID=A0ABP9VZR5_9BACT
MLADDIRNLYINGLTKPNADILRKQTIEKGNPGSILIDIQMLIEAIGEGLPTTSKYFLLPQGRLDEFNQRLTTPLVHNIKRPQLRSFPALMGLFLLLRSSGLVVGEDKPKRRMFVDPEMRAQWESLEPTDQYMSLLGTCMTTASFEIVGERGMHSHGLKQRFEDAYLYLDRRKSSILDDLGLEYHVAYNLMHQFGWLRLKYASEAKAGKSAELQWVERLPFGDAMFCACCGLKNRVSDSDEEFQATLKPYFPEWKKSLTEPESEFQEFQFTLKVSWGDVWRRIVAPDETTLEELAALIIEAFDFEFDHLYQFEYRNKRGQNETVICPQLRDGVYFADEMMLGHLPIGKGESMLFHFDFGDDWKFNVLIEDLSDLPDEYEEPKITDRFGEAPKQYPFEDEWDDEDDDEDDYGDEDESTQG